MELERCICGGMPIQRTYLNTLCETRRIHYIECLKCGKQTNGYKTKYNAERAWNNWMKKIKTIKPGDSIYATVTNNSCSNAEFQITCYTYDNENRSEKVITEITKNKKEASKFKTWWNKYFAFIYVMEVG